VGARVLVVLDRAEVADLNYYEHHLGDYAAATGHLSWDEDMAYTRLLRAYYHHERGIPQGQAYRLARAATAAQRKAVDAVLVEFFVLADGMHGQKRADEEIARFQDKQRKAKASADARWSQSGRNANALQEAHPDAMRTHSEGNAPSLQTPVSIPKEEKEIAPSAPAPRPSAAPPPPAFDGLNAEALNGKAIVPIAAGWELPETWGTDAMALGFKTNEVLHEAERFRQYWTVGKGAGKRRNVKGWRQSWSTWLGKASENRR
jgi:uncharacterized protein YdaU (DUF1376 family)